jgi:hypothetical protein
MCCWPKCELVVAVILVDVNKLLQFSLRFWCQTFEFLCSHKLLERILTVVYYSINFSFQNHFFGNLIDFLIIKITQNSIYVAP